NLKRLADRSAIARQRLALSSVSVPKNAAGLAGKAQECASLHRLQEAYIAFTVAERTEATFGGEIEHLSARHTADAGGTRQRVDQSNADSGVRMGLFARQNVEGESQKPVAREDGGSLVEFAVRGGLAPAQFVIVHRR